MAAELVAPHIEVEAAVAGGQPRIAGRRITVRDVALWQSISAEAPTRSEPSPM